MSYSASTDPFPAGGQLGTASLLNSVFWSLAGMVVFALHSDGLVTPRPAFALLTFFLIAFVLFELRVEAARTPGRWFMSPAVLCSIFTFVAGYGVSNALFLMPRFEEFVLYRTSGFFEPMVLCQFLALLGVTAMWIGYRLRFFAELGRSMRKLNLLPRAGRVSTVWLLVLVAASVGSTLMQLRLGIYGYTATPEKLIAAASVSQYLFLLGSLGTFALVLIALQAFGPEGRRSDMLLLITLLVVETGFGFLSGFKNQVIMPTLVVLFARYVAGRGISKSLLLVSVALLISAYVVIEPFRARINKLEERNLGSLGAVAAVLGDTRELPNRPRPGTGSIFEELLLRLNLTAIGSHGLVYANTPELHSEDDPAFLDNLVLAPLYAFVPRFLWKSKPLGITGWWYTTKVMGVQVNSSTAMGPVTYFYLAGGTVLVIIGFLCFGLTQRFLYEWLNPGLNFAGAVVFLAILKYFTLMPSELESLWVNLYREVPVVIVLLNLLLRRWSAGGR